MPTFLAGDGGRKGLDDAVANHPGRQEAPDRPEVPAEHAAQVHRQGHHEPDIAGAEQEHPRRREDVDCPALGQDVAKPGLGFGLAQVLLQQDQAADPDQRQDTRHGQQGTFEADRCQQGPAQKEADTLECVLRAGEDRHPLVELALLPIRNQKLDGAFGAHLVQVFGNPRQRLSPHHPRDGQPGARHRQHQQRRDLKAQPDVHGPVKTQPGAEVAPHQVGNHAKQFVEQKQGRDLKGAVAQRVEVQHHQHAQGAVGEGEGPVIARDQQVLPHWRSEG